MNRAELFEFHQAFTADMFAICKAKNSDYAGQEEGANPFANFARVEALGIVKTELGFLVRMADKMSRLATLLQPGAEAKVKDESVHDTLVDLANYSLLLAAYLKHRKKASMPPGTMDYFAQAFLTAFPPTKPTGGIVK